MPETAPHQTLGFIRSSSIALCGLCMLLSSGCQLVVPSVRSGSVPCETCDKGVRSEADESLAADQTGPAPTSSPDVRAPHSKFHPVPTHPVFAVSHLPPELEAEAVPTPAQDEPQEIDPPQVDALPEPEEETEADDEGDLQVSEAKPPKTVAIRWVEEP